MFNVADRRPLLIGFWLPGLESKAYEMVREGKWGEMAAIRGNKIISVPLAEAVGELSVSTKKLSSGRSFLG